MIRSDRDSLMKLKKETVLCNTQSCGPLNLRITKAMFYFIFISRQMLESKVGLPGPVWPVPKIKFR